MPARPSRAGTLAEGSTCEIAAPRRCSSRSPRPRAAWAARRDDPLAGPADRRRALDRAAAVAPQRFDLVGAALAGLRPRPLPDASLAGRWSAWRRAAPEAEDRPDPREPPRRARGRGWHLGNPYWVGPSDRIACRLVGDVRAPARLVRLERRRARRRCGRVSTAGSPQIVPRAAWQRERGDHARRRRAMRTRVCARGRPPHGRLERVHARPQSAAIVRGDRALPRARERLERHRLQLPRRPVRPGLRGPRRRDRPERHRRARPGVQHRLGRRRAARQLRLGRVTSAAAAGARRAARLAARRRARRPARPRQLGRPAEPEVRARDDGRSCARSRATATPASRRAPATRLYSQLPGDRARTWPRPGCRSSTAPWSKGRSAGRSPSRRGSRAPRRWTVTVRDRGGTTVAPRHGLAAPRSPGRGTRAGHRGGGVHLDDGGRAPATRPAQGTFGRAPPGALAGAGSVLPRRADRRSAGDLAGRRRFADALTRLVPALRSRVGDRDCPGRDRRGRRDPVRRQLQGRAAQSFPYAAQGLADGQLHVDGRRRRGGRANGARAGAVRDRPHGHRADAEHGRR